VIFHTPVAILFTYCGHKSADDYQVKYRTVFVRTNFSYMSLSFHSVNNISVSLWILIRSTGYVT